MILPDHPTLDGALRLGLAFALALPLGWRRGKLRPPWPSLRTYSLLSVCVCAFFLLARDAGWGPYGQAEAVFGMLGGIGFVGAGAILKSPDPEGTRGLSMAVSLWVTGAIGAGVAFGALLISAALALMSVLAMILPSLATRWRREAS